ncbi:MAG: SixA phosphatase family protein [Bacteroidota bacterium]
MKLHLIRHAKTEQSSQTGKDFDRKLMHRGQKQSLELNQFLSNQDFKNTTVLCSSAVRTKETLSYLTDNFKNENCFYNKDLYLCSLQNYLDLLWKQGHGNDLVLIGHNFGISDLANYFLDDLIELRTAEYLLITFPFDKWSETSKATGSLSLRYRPAI